MRLEWLMIGVGLALVMFACDGKPADFEITRVSKGPARLVGCVQKDCRQIGDTYDLRSDCLSAASLLNRQADLRVAHKKPEGARYSCLSATPTPILHTPTQVPR